MITNYLYLKKWIKKIFNVEKIKTLTFYILLFLIPFKTSKHFFISESILNGKIIDYFLPTIYIQDFLIIIFILFSLISFLKKRNSKVISKYQKIISLMFLLFIPLLLFFNHQYLKDKIFIIKYLRVIEYIFLIVSILIQKKNFLDVKKEQFSKTTFIQTNLKKASIKNVEKYRGILRVKVRKGTALRNKILGAIEHISNT